MLVLICEVCTTPMIIPEHIELVLSGCKVVICAECKQSSVVPEELKKQIKRKWGMYQ